MDGKCPPTINYGLVYRLRVSPPAYPVECLFPVVHHGWVSCRSMLALVLVIDQASEERSFSYRSLAHLISLARKLLTGLCWH